MEQKTKPQGVKLNILRIVWLILVGLAIGGGVSWWWPLSIIFFDLLLGTAGWLISRAGGPDLLAHRVAWLIYRVRHVRAFRKRLKTETDILKAAQAEDKRTGTTVKERYDREIKQIKQKDFEKAQRWKDRKRRWFKGGN